MQMEAGTGNGNGEKDKGGGETEEGTEEKIAENLRKTEKEKLPFRV